MEQRGWPSTFPALRQRINGHPLAYLDSAATTLRPQSVIDALVEYYSAVYANPARVRTLATRAAERLAAARQTVAGFVNAADPSEIVFVRGTTEGINLVAATWGAVNLRRGDDIVLTVAEHSSNLMPWTRLARRAGANVRGPRRRRRGAARSRPVEEGSVETNACPRVQPRVQRTGVRQSRQRECALARQVGACTVIDGAQGAPHVWIDVQDLGCDFYVFSGHKMLGPMATGVVWGRRDLLNAIPPYHVGSNMAHGVDFERADLESGAQSSRPASRTSRVRWGSRLRCGSSRAPGLTRCGTTTRIS
jgi:selenocysteine lyase/cysteine desulfurase